MAVLRDNLQPTDFADAICRVTDWSKFSATHSPTIDAYRIWICQCGNHWFQRHEWRHKGRNSTDLEPWLYSGYCHRKTFPDHAKIDGFDLMEI